MLCDEFQREERAHGLAGDGEARLHQRRAFTLIELLVVIAVISILAALLLPVLRSSMNAACTVHCHSNLKNTGQAFHMYAEEQKGILPFRHEKSGGGWISWWQLLRTYSNKYYGCSEKMYRTQYGAPGIESNLGYCPLYDCTWYLDNAHGGAGWLRCDVVRNEYYHLLTYGANSFVCNPEEERVFTRMHDIRHPAALILVAEALTGHMKSLETAYFNPRHGEGHRQLTMTPCGELVLYGGKAPAVHADGHVDQYGPEDCISSDYTNRYKPHKAPQEQVQQWGLYLNHRW